MMAITHELKTPIAVAKLNLETMQKHHLDEQKRQKLIEMTLQETNRLNALANNILVSAQLEAGKRSDKEELNFSDLAKELCERFQKTLCRTDPGNATLQKKLNWKAIHCYCRYS